MNVREIVKHIDEALEVEEIFDHIMDALETLHADYRFVELSHDKYLPACREYREY